MEKNGSYPRNSQIRESEPQPPSTAQQGPRAPEKARSDTAIPDAVMLKKGILSAAVGFGTPEAAIRSVPDKAHAVPDVPAAVAMPAADAEIPATAAWDEIINDTGKGGRRVPGNAPDGGGGPETRGRQADSASEPPPASRDGAEEGHGGGTCGEKNGPGELDALGEAWAEVMATQHALSQMLSLQSEGTPSQMSGASQVCPEILSRYDEAWKRLRGILARKDVDVNAGAAWEVLDSDLRATL